MAGSNGAENPLSASKIITTIQNSIDSSSEIIKSPWEAFALFIHACMLNVDFTLLGFAEDDRLEQQIELTNIQRLPSQWKDSSTYGFRYKHIQSSMRYLLKVYRLGGKSIVTGLGLEDDKTATLEITTQDFFSESFFPFNMAQSSEAKTIEQGFISSSRVTDLANLFKIQIVQKLMPGLHKPGYVEETATTDSSRTSNRSEGQIHNQPLRTPVPPQPYPLDPADPLRYPPRIPQPRPTGVDLPPGFEDEFEIQRGPRSVMPGGRSPFDIGSHDLNPPGLGPNPPLLGPFFGEAGGGGMSPYGEFGGPGGGGMYPTGSHPMFGDRRGTDRGRTDLRFPPGSRYDPVGPGGPGPGLPRPGGGNPFSGFNQDDFI